MSSYAGRHRTPSSPTNHRRTVAALGTAGVVIAAPLAVGAPAEAASGRTWDRLANCESGGDWNISTGNGYYGGLQFSGGTWRAYGGGSYASSANRATRGEQIIVAERVLDAQGWGAWPACSRKLGLTRADASGSPDVSRSSTRKAVPAKKTSAKKATAKKTAARKTAARKTAKATTTRAAAASGSSYVVRSGDTLSRIAKRTSVSGGWKAVYSANRKAIGANPNRIHVGQHLVLPR